ncbi:GtrA family protein [uncultured Corynebacterium sp.]|uniref:GtrA family protein n=1 Tax=uncultured Corynebacterium sp. TaxID=159447 RepID=UPI00288B3AF1|nr:GtrA family protein [uncultured Corynebacterium sp.]
MATSAEKLSRSNSLQAQGTKFVITGVISAIVDAGLTWLLQLGLGLLDKDGARTVGFIFGTLVAYLLNRRWTFNAKASKRRLAAVAATYALTYLVNMVIYRRAFNFFDEDLAWSSTLALVVAYVLAQGTATIINFFVQRWVIFRRTRKSFVVED